jgi:hypothetical protein
MRNGDTGYRTQDTGDELRIADWGNSVAATSLSDIVYKFQVVTRSRLRGRRILLCLRFAPGQRIGTGILALRHLKPQSPFASEDDDEHEDEKVR